MMVCSNVHTHCTWCDGDNTPEEIVQAALAQNFSDIGFSSHAPAPFDPGCPGLVDERAYRNDIAALREKYRGKLGVLCGIETDYYAPADKQLYDYTIGSTHYLPVRQQDGKPVFIAADDSQKALLQAKQDWYNGDGEAMAEAFFALSAKNICENKPTIVGHFDVIKKCNQNGCVFDEQSKRYKIAALQALDVVLDTIAPYGGMIEVNTGGISRGYCTVPYPAGFLLKHIAARGGRVIITSDCHSANALTAYFDLALQQIKQAGFSTLAMLKKGEFVDCKL